MNSKGQLGEPCYTSSHLLSIQNYHSSELVKLHRFWAFTLLKEHLLLIIQLILNVLNWGFITWKNLNGNGNTSLNNSTKF